MDAPITYLDLLIGAAVFWIVITFAVWGACALYVWEGKRRHNRDRNKRFARSSSPETLVNLSGDPPDWWF